MDNQDYIKSAGEASGLFHNTTNTSVIDVNALDVEVRKLYCVTFDDNNTAFDARLASPGNWAGKGLASWDKKTLFTKYLHVEACNEREALTIAQQNADTRIQRG